MDRARPAGLKPAVAVLGGNLRIRIKESDCVKPGIEPLDPREAVVEQAAR